MYVWACVKDFQLSWPYRHKTLSAKYVVLYIIIRTSPQTPRIFGSSFLALYTRRVTQWAIVRNGNICCACDPVSHLRMQNPPAEFQPKIK